MKNAQMRERKREKGGKLFGRAGGQAVRQADGQAQIRRSCLFGRATTPVGWAQRRCWRRATAATAPAAAAAPAAYRIPRLSLGASPLAKSLAKRSGCAAASMGDALSSYCCRETSSSATSHNALPCADTQQVASNNNYNNILLKHYATINTYSTRIYINTFI